jgi:23S rRNA (cytosine1962-C5)-methyltransferase
MRQFDVTISRRGVERVEDGHLWIYRSDILDASEAKGGGCVRVGDERGRFIAQALYSSRSEIAVRVLTTNQNERIDRDWWSARLRDSIARRAGLDKQTNAYRLVYSEGDMLPSLIVDKYGDCLVMQTLSQGTEHLKLMFIEILLAELKPRAIIERNDVRVREFEGLAMRKSVLYGTPPEEIPVVQHGVRSIVAPLGGQKTGAFLDQRENHAAAERFARGRALDCFTFNGAFATHIARHCESVIGIDVSIEALAMARRNAELNGARNIEFREANVFDALREYDDANERFDTIILDPPAFAKNRASLEAAIRGYKEINLRALKMLNKGGILITCTCSYHMHEDLFYSLLADAAADARRRVQIVEKRIQSSDHPVLVGVPETLYLKCAVLRVIE